MIKGKVVNGVRGDNKMITRKQFTEWRNAILEEFNNLETIMNLAISPTLVNNLMNQEGRSTGNAALWFLFPHSVAIWRTFVG